MFSWGFRAPNQRREYQRRVAHGPRGAANGLPQSATRRRSPETVLESWRVVAHRPWNHSIKALDNLREISFKLQHIHSTENMRIFALVVALLACPAIAQNARVVSEVVRRSGYEQEVVERYWSTGCDEAGPNAQNICVLYSYVSEDLGLNDVYQVLLGKLTDDTARSKLRDAQRAWLSFRDASCRFESHGEGGLLAAQIVNGCLATLTSKRRAELQQYLSQMAHM